MLMTLYMYLGHIPFSIKNLKREILESSLEYDIGWSNLAKPVFALYYTYKEMYLQMYISIVMLLLHNTLTVFV